MPIYMYIYYTHMCIIMKRLVKRQYFVVISSCDALGTLADDCLSFWFLNLSEYLWAGDVAFLWRLFLLLNRLWVFYQPQHHKKKRKEKAREQCVECIIK